MSSNTSWQDLAKAKKLRQQEAIPPAWKLASPPEYGALDVRTFPESPQCGLLTSREIEITNTTDVDALLSNLATAKWSSEEVTRAFYKRAIIAHQLVNCLTEIFVDRAIERAKELDKYLKETGKPYGPLHGLPISLKDQVRIKGLEATIGHTSWVGKYSEDDAVLTKVLYSCGAVPFVMTNVPQTLMWPETYNLIFGRTLNPANRTLTSGGSSGGEGALIAMKGSPLGVGSDIGGSIRYPSTFNGLYGFRPSSCRIPYSGAVNTLEGLDTAPSVLGPLSNSLSGVKAFLKAVIQSEPWVLDPLAIRKKWDEDAYRLADHGNGKQLCFGIMADDGNVIPHPPIQRALKVVEAALVAAGHKVVPWTPHKHQELYDNVAKIWMAAAAEDINAVLSPTGEPRLTTMAPEGSAGVADVGVTYAHTLSAYELWQIQKARTGLREEYLAVWRDSVKYTGTGRPVDAIIAPVAPHAACPHGKTPISTYTAVWNSLNYACCAFPVTSVDPVQDRAQPRSEFLGEKDRRNWELYSPETFKNAPVGLQVVGQMLEEEAVLAMTEIVDKALRAYKTVTKAKL
ncbi:general amidase [Dichomitus squalens]|uniref:amidase n=1 Tax=Dichomitus squalens TaxID=114155 RepID=A0A4Q9N8C5_9APHY|nr:general amidase [Dichomitus squalens]